MSINIERVNIFNLLTSTTSNLSIQCPPEIKFVININSMLKGCEILVDANRLIQVLNNIINNAFKFTSRGSVHFEALFNQTKTHVVIKVKDTGIGISKKALPYIFNRFYQSDRINDGTGLGLAICKSLIESMNGNISVTSEVNRGSLFVISIPC
jgi:signal transduction histidine kinase